MTSIKLPQDRLAQAVTPREKVAVLRDLTEAVYQGVFAPPQPVVEQVARIAKATKDMEVAEHAVVGFLLAQARTHDTSGTMIALLGIAKQAQSPDVAALAIGTAGIVFREAPVFSGMEAIHPMFQSLRGRETRHSSPLRRDFDWSSDRINPVTDALDRMQRTYNRLTAGRKTQPMPFSPV